MAVIDSSSAIALAKIGRLAILHKLFDDVFITEQVYGEVISKPLSEEAITIKKAVEEKWIVIRKAREINNILGVGEASSISLALELRQILIIDDKKAVFIANSFLGAECHGILYAILLALKQGIIKNKEEAIEIVNELISSKFYLSGDVLSEFYSMLQIWLSLTGRKELYTCIKELQSIALLL